MTRLLSNTAFALVAGFTLPALAVDSPVKDPSACQLSWTTVDSDKSGTISEAEATAATEAEFVRIDVNGDGLVSVTEWKDCGDPAAYPGEPAPGNTPAAATDASAGTDTAAEPAAGSAETAIDAQGQVSPASDQAAADLTVEPPETENSAVAELTGRTGLPWNEDDFPSALDVDKSGDLSFDEAMEASRSGYDPAMGSEEDVARWSAGIFARSDANADSKLSAEEWSGRNEATINAAFARIDADANGEVSRDEWNRFRESRFDASAQAAAGEEPTLWIFYYNVM